MLIQTCNAMKTNHNDQLHVQHTTNAKYTKYLHLGTRSYWGTRVKYLRHNINILEVPKYIYIYIYATEHCDKHKHTEYKIEIKNKVLKL